MPFNGNSDKYDNLRIFGFDAREKTMVAIQPAKYALLFAACIANFCAAISEGSKGNTTISVFVHRKTNSKSCELVQRGSFVSAKEFAWVEVEGEKSETYSPEMGPEDYLSASPPIFGRAAKDARKSGFEFKEESAILTHPPRVLALASDVNCPGLQSAISEVEQAQALRRTALQARIYIVGADDIVAPSPLNEKESHSKSGQSAAANNSSGGTAGKTKKKFHGTVVLKVLIGADGTVQQSKIIRPVNPELDKNATEEVSRWKFAPARKKGLPVPSVMPVEVTFNLY
jgi:TonB family protein